MVLVHETKPGQCDKNVNLRSNMAWHGEAQVITDDVFNVTVSVKRFGLLVAECTREIDSQHCASQIKLDILQDVKLPIPRGMKENARDCLVVICVKGKRMKMDDYKRLCEFGQYLNGAEISEISLEILDPEAVVVDDEVNLVDDFRVHPRGQLAQEERDQQEERRRRRQQQQQQQHHCQEQHQQQ